MRSSFSRLCLLLVASATATATPFKRATDGSSGLIVSLTSSPTAKSADDITITATIENTGTDEAKILKYGSVLDNEHPTQSFRITTGDGNEVTFQGTRLHLATDLPAGAFIVIPPGGRVTKTHSNLNGVYDFSGGPTTYTFAATQTTYTQNDSNSTRFKSESSAASVQVQVTGTTAKRELEYERDNLICEDANGAAQIRASFSEGLTLAALAVQYIQTFGPSNALFQAYFGAQAVDIPLTVLARVANENTNRNFYCYDPVGGCEDGVIAYTLTSTLDIYFCSPFFYEVGLQRLCTDSPPAARNSRGGTTLHELTHATSGTVDNTYGCDSDSYLASMNPLAAASNADNYNCFATSVYYVTQC